ncbi:MAG: response regulator [Balneolales bacterium]|nr:response regulator [Balneolales bacterium]
MAATILIVDDEPNIVISLEFLLAQHGFKPYVSRNGEQAIDFIDSNATDLILLDVMMPGKSGFDVLQHIRKKATSDQPKVVMLTARGREQDIKKGTDLGADAYITKPFSTRELIKLIKSLLSIEH